MRDTSLVTFALLTVLVSGLAHAGPDLSTSFGLGYKTGNTSLVLQPGCHTAVPFDAAGARYRDRDITSCGGDFPAFIGWPIAATWDDCMLPAMSCKLGWFHYSNWFDGGRDRETHMDVIAVEFEYSWTGRRQRAAAGGGMTADALRELNTLRDVVRYAPDYR